MVTDQLSDLLHRSADELPVFVRGPAALRRDAERARSRRRRFAAVTSMAVVVAGVVVGAAALAGGIERSAAPVNQGPRPTVTLPPTPPDQRGLLRPADLPTGAGFGQWTGPTPVPADQTPFCLDGAASPESAVYVEFANSQPGVTAFQGMLTFPAGSTAHVAGPEIVQAMRACGSIQDAGYDGLQGASGGEMILPWSHRSDVGSRELVLTHHGRYASLLWISAPDAERLDDMARFRLVALAHSRVYEGTEPATRDLPPGTLADAILDPADVPYGTAAHGTVYDQGVAPNQFNDGHLCDPAVGGVPENPVVRQAQFLESAGPDALDVGGQRLYVTASSDEASRLFETLQDDLPECPGKKRAPFTVTEPTELDTDALASSGGGGADEARGWTYRYDFTEGDRRDESDVIYAVFTRTGSVVSEVWRRERAGARDPGAAAVLDETATALTLLRDTLPADLLTGARTG